MLYDEARTRWAYVFFAVLLLIPTVIFLYNNDYEQDRIDKRSLRAYRDMDTMQLSPTTIAPVKAHPEWQSFGYAGDVTEIAVGYGGIVWTAGRSNGVTAWDIDSGTYQQYGPEHGLVDNAIYDIDVGPDGRVWVVSTYHGLGVFDGYTWESITEINNEPIEGLRSVAATAEGVWASGDGIYHYDGKEWTVSHVDAPVDKIVVSDSGNVYSTLNGLSEWDGTEWQQLTTSWVTDFVVTAEDEIWAVDLGDRIMRYKNGKWTSFYTAEIGMRDKVDAYAVTTDEAGNVWVAVDYAILKYDGQMWQRLPYQLLVEAMDATGEGVLLWSQQYAQGFFSETADQHMHYELDDPPNISHSVDLISVDPQGTVWMDHRTVDALYRLPASDDNGIAGSGEWEYVSRNSDDSISDVAYASDGTTWFLGISSVFRLRNDHIRKYTPCHSLFDSSLNWHRDITVAGDDSVWVVCENSLVHYVNGRWRKIDAPADKGAFSHIASANNGIYIATDKGYIIAYDIASQDWSIVTQAFKVEEIRDIVAVDDELWVASEDRGVYVFALVNGTWEESRHYTTTDGLVSNTIISMDIQEDNPVQWFGGAGGATCFDDVSWTSYTIAHGLDGDFVWDIARSPDGSMWFTLDGGASHFTPAVTDSETCPSP